MKWLKSFIIVLVIMILAASFVEAKGFSSGGRSSFSSGSRSFSSGSRSMASSSSKSFSSSSTSAKSSSAFSSSSRTSVPKTYMSSSGRIDSSKVNFKSPESKSFTFKTNKATPSTYGTYSRKYYSQPSGISSNFLMYYMIIDSMSDAAVMTAMANKDAGYDAWKKTAAESGDPALLAKIAALETKMASLNATNATNGTYMDPAIEAQLKQAVDGAEPADDEMGWIGFLLIGMVLLIITGVWLVVML